jgi:6-pyruvoyltetrahydropterin/6-carboxytetrahydropterin synthase
MGHRVWSQTLDSEYARTTSCKCRHLHGHEVKIVVTLTADQLVNGMVTDFNNLTWLKEFLDKYIDHKFIIDSRDPLYHNLVGPCSLEPVIVPDRLLTAGRIPDTLYLEVPIEEKELLESFFIVDFVPTSENLSRWLAEIVQEKMKDLNVTVSNVVWWESSKSRSEFSF